MKIFHINSKALKENLKTKRTDSAVYFDIDGGVRLASCLSVNEGSLAGKKIVIRKVLTTKKSLIFAKNNIYSQVSMNTINVYATVDNGDGTFSTMNITKVPSIQNIVSTEEVPAKEDVTIIAIGEQVMFLHKLDIADIFVKPEDDEDIYIAYEIVS
jgi:hypothetical protein